jgi:serine/threonine-protein kinase
MATSDPSRSLDVDPSSGTTMPPPGPPGEISSPSPPAATPPRRLGRYELGEEIARGGMGAVLLAHDPVLERDLAVKVLKPDFHDCPELLRRFVVEAQITAQLPHPGIVPVHELGHDDNGLPFLAMKLVRGDTLEQLLAQRTSPAEELPRFVSIFEQVCQAVAFAHSRRVIHRDLKPANIMVGRFAEVQVMDWGLAKPLASRERQRPEDLTEEEKAAGEAVASMIRTLRTAGAGGERGATEAGTVLGTPAYMPPEQAAGQVQSLDERCDVFGLGGILCEVLTGKPPYVAPDNWRVLCQAALGEVADAFGRLDGCGADVELVALVKECLSPEIDSRPRDAGEVAQRVAVYQRGVQERLRQAEQERAAALARAEEARATARAEQRARRRTLALVSVATAALLLGGAAAAWYAQERSARQARAESEAEAALREARTWLTQEPEQERRDPERWMATVGLADAALQRAEAAIVTAAVNADLQERTRKMRTEVEPKKRDSRLRVELDRIRLEKAAVKEGHFDSTEAVQRYRDVLSGYGIDPGNAAAAAVVVRGSRLRGELLAALEDWARATKDARELDRLRVVLSAAEPEEEGLRAQWRQMVRGWDGVALAKLASAARGLAATDVVNLAGDLVRLGQRGAAERLLRDGRRRFPADFWINHDLGMVLLEQVPPQPVEAVRYLTAAAALRSQSPGARLNLGNALATQGQWMEAAASYREAIDLDPRYAQAYSCLGNALVELGQLPEAAAACRRAIDLTPRDAAAHNNLGTALAAQGHLVEAIAEYRLAIDLDPKLAMPHNNLGLALKVQGKVAEAMAEYQKAIDLDPRHARAHTNRGNVLQDQGKLVEAIAEYRLAIGIDPRLAYAHNNLGNALRAQGHLVEAIVEYQKAIAIDPRYAVAHSNLGLALEALGKLAEAVAEHQKAVAIDPGYAEGYGRLAGALLQRGDLAEAQRAAQRCLQLLPPEHPLRDFATQRLRRCEAALAMDAKLPAILRREARPANAAETLAFAEFCLQCKQLHAAAARFYADAFAAEPQLAADPRQAHRYNAACSAALAAAGQGKDADKLDGKERQRLRRQALDWLRADVAAWTERLSDASPKDREAIRKVLENWQQDADLTGLRDDKALADLPAGERDACKKLWTDVAALVQKAGPPR